ncbi:MAG: phage major capsid protein [Myxococcales bacterium]|nr:phage major capsid protein [Myxococcales bacterium]
MRELREGEVRVLAPDQRLSDCPEIREAMRLPDGIQPGEISFGRFLRGAVTGNWKGAEAEQRAMSVAEDIVGGFTLTDQMAVSIIDLARARSRVIQAGARTLPMQTSQLKIAIQESDPTGVWRAENTAITSSDINFGQFLLSAKTLAALVPVSIELMEDAQNTDRVVSNAITEALGLALDLAALLGEGSAIKPTGIRNTTGIQTIDQGTNGSAITDYTEMSQAWEKIVTKNGPETGLAAIYSPREAGTMDRFVDGQGQPQTPPLSVQGMKRLPINQVPINLTKGSSSNASDIYVGNFREMLIGMRTQLVIEASRQATDTVTGLGFASMTVWVRAYLRADVALIRPNQFCVIDGVIP